MAKRLTDAERALREIPEAHLQARIIDLAHLRGWRVFHDHDSRRNPSGLPDLVLVRRCRLVFAELKRETGKVRPEQAEWISDLTDVAEVSLGAVEVYVWRPSDWTEIQQVLR